MSDLVPWNKLAFEPDTAKDAYATCRLLFASGLLPRAVQSPEAAFYILCAGRELGLTMTQSFRALHVIDGKVVLSADMILAQVKRAPECLYFRLVESTSLVAVYETHRQGDPEPTKLTFTIEQARLAGLLGKDNWRKYPDAMLRARCIAALARAVYPDAALGLYDPDEMSDTVRPATLHVRTEPDLFGSLLSAMQTAVTKQDFDVLAVRIQTAKAGLSDAQMKELRALWAQRKPPSSKRVVPSATEVVSSMATLAELGEALDQTPTVDGLDALRSEIWDLVVPAEAGEEGIKRHDALKNRWQEKFVKARDAMNAKGK